MSDSDETLHRVMALCLQFVAAFLLASVLPLALQGDEAWFDHAVAGALIIALTLIYKELHAIRTA